MSTNLLEPTTGKAPQKKITFESMAEQHPIEDSLSKNDEPMSLSTTSKIDIYEEVVKRMK